MSHTRNQAIRLELPTKIIEILDQKAACRYLDLCKYIEILLIDHVSPPEYAYNPVPSPDLENTQKMYVRRSGKDDPELASRRAERWARQDEERKIKRMKLAARKAQEFHAAIVARMVERFIPFPAGLNHYPARDGSANIVLTPLKFYVDDADRVGGEFITLPVGQYAFRRWAEDEDANPIDAAMVEGCAPLRVCENHAYKSWLLEARGAHIPKDDTRGILDRLADMFGSRTIDGIETRIDPNRGAPQFRSLQGHWVYYTGDVRVAYDEELRRVAAYEKSLGGTHG